MCVKIKVTSDGSVTLYSETFKENYHSTAGAVAESEHVFINAGLKKLNINGIKILEVGFGTGLNAFLTLHEAIRSKILIDYFAIELYPLEEKILQVLNNSEPFKSDILSFTLLHKYVSDQRMKINNYFNLTVINDDIINASLGEGYNLVYFDAFSPEVQPELWTENMFAKIFNSMTKGGILNTYCAKGIVRRNMQNAGFLVERLPGLPPKREMLSARK